MIVMDDEKKRGSARERRARCDARKRAAGLVPVTVWVDAKYRTAIINYAKFLASG